MQSICPPCPPSVTATNFRTPTRFLPLQRTETSTIRKINWPRARTFLYELRRNRQYRAAIDIADQLLNEIESYNLPEPSVAMGPDGMIGITWESNSLHLSVEVFSDEHLEFFSECLDSGKIWGNERPADEELQPQERKLLQLLAG